MLILNLLLVSGACGMCHEGQQQTSKGCIDCRFTNCKTCNGKRECQECKDELTTPESGCIICVDPSMIFANGRCRSCMELGVTIEGPHGSGGCFCELDTETGRTVKPECCSAESGAAIFFGQNDFEGGGKRFLWFLCNSCEHILGCERCYVVHLQYFCIKCKDGWRQKPGSEPYFGFLTLYGGCVPDERWKGDARKLGVGRILVLTMLTLLIL